MKRTKKARRVKIEGQDTIGAWHFSNNFVLTREEEIADILRDAKSEYTRYWDLSDELQKEVRKEIDNIRVVNHKIRVVNHKHNARIQRFSVYVPKTLLKKMQDAWDEGKLFQDYIEQV